MLGAQGFNSSAYEKFKILSTTGGIPWYIEQMQGQYTAEENIRRQCFSPGGIMVDDFDMIFHELFEKKDKLYKNIIFALADGPVRLDDVANQAHYPKSGRLIEYLDNLIKAGFISKDYTWSLKTGELLNLCLYRLSDNYLRFYLKYIRPKKIQIKANRIKKLTVSTMRGWDTIMGLQFENLIVNNRHELYKILNIAVEDIIYDNPFFQNKTQRQKGCQIDFLIQTKHKTLYVFEIKFSRNTIKKSVIAEVKEKINRMAISRGMAVLPVLIHVNGVSERVVEEDYFYNIIDFSELL